MKRYDLVIENVEYCLRCICENGKWGIYDLEDKKEIISPQYDDISILDNKHFAAKNGELSVIINDKNEIVFTITQKCLNISLCEDNYILVEREDSLQYISLDGKASNIYDDIGYFGDSPYVFVQKGNYYGLIDRNLTEVIPTKYDTLIHTKDNIYLAQQNDKLFVIDAQTKTEELLDYSLASQHYNTHFIVKKNNLMGVIDINLNFVLPLEYTFITSYSRNVFLVRKPGDRIPSLRISILDLPNNEQQIYNNISRINSHFFSSKNKDGKRALFNVNGKQLTDYKYDLICSVVMDDNIEVHVYKSNSEVCKGFIDKNGKEILPPIYEEIVIHRGGYAVKLNGKYAIFDSNFKCVSKFIYDKVRSINSYCKIGRHAEVLLNGVEGIYYW